MARWTKLETVTTRHLGITIIAVIVATIAAFAVMIHFHVATVDTLSKLSDAVFKVVALIVGALWTLNRYFMSRADATQFRVDCEVMKILGENALAPALLAFRLDLVNTGRALINEFLHYIEIHEVRATSDGIEYRQIYRWPEKGSHIGGPIEPGSWSAINGETTCSSSVKAIRIFVLAILSKDQEWTWHKTFDVSGGKNAV